MTYSTLIQIESVQSNFLAILRPRRRVSGFTLFSGSVYQASFDYGTMFYVEQNGSAMVQGSSSTLSANGWYWDDTTNILYVRLASGLNPNTVYLVGTYEIYCGTADAHWYRIPTDPSTRTVYFDPLINKSPLLKATMSDTLFGYLPVQTSGITLINAEHVFEKHIYDSSFNKAQIQVYHWLGDSLSNPESSLSTSNINLVYDGLMQDVEYEQNKITIKTFDGTDVLSNEYRVSGGNNFYDSVTWPNVDPNYIGRPVRVVYGLVDGFQPINISYVSDNPTTSQNRTWAVCQGQIGLSEVVKTVAVSPVSTTTRTYLNSIQGISIGDSVWFDRVVGTDEYHIVTNVNSSPAYIEHEALVSAMASGDSVRRGFVSKVTIIQNGVVFIAQYGRDYTVSLALAGNSSGFVFANNFEANLSMSTLLTTDTIFARVYGRVNDITLGGPAFGSNDTDTGNITHPVQIILDLLKSNIGVPEASINSSIFATALGSVTNSAIGLSIPHNANDNFPSYKDIVSEVLATGLLQIFLDQNAKWSLHAIAPLTTDTYAIASDEILDGSFNYSFDFNEIASDIIVNYNLKELSSNPVTFNQDYDQVTASSLVALYVHKLTKQKSINSLHFKRADAQILANRMAFIFGDREGRIKFRTKNRFFQTLIGDTIDVTRIWLPGFNYDGTTSFSRQISVLGTERSLKEVTIEMTDQKGIQDNSGSW